MIKSGSYKTYISCLSSIFVSASKVKNIHTLNMFYLFSLV